MLRRRARVVGDDVIATVAVHEIVLLYKIISVTFNALLPGKRSSSRNKMWTWLFLIVMSIEFHHVKLQSDGQEGVFADFDGERRDVRHADEAAAYGDCDIIHGDLMLKMMYNVLKGFDRCNLV